MSSKLYPLALAATLAISPAHAYEDQELRILIWDGYLTENTVSRFTQETGIEVRVDSLREAGQLIAAAQGGEYDLISPPMHSLKALAEAHQLLPLDRSILPNYRNLDETRLAAMFEADPGNRFAVPFVELSTGIGYNEDLVREALGDDSAMASWAAVLSPEGVAALSSCGVAFIDSPSDLICSALIYLGKDFANVTDDDIAEAGQVLSAAFNAGATLDKSCYDYVGALASGKVCAVVGWSGDVVTADLASMVEGGPSIRYVIPDEGAVSGYDSLVIPAAAPHPANAHAFLNYVMDPEVSAEITNSSNYAGINRNATEFVRRKIVENRSIYYPNETLRRMHLVIPSEEQQQRFAEVFGSASAAARPMAAAD
ncbi:MAG: extracellular solute-binding protein [Succinivibrionaceae bacterium]|nr:extracellular solute-binding protein [Succinivibrionaceae bacterium]